MATAFNRERPPLPFIHPDTMPDVYAAPGRGSCMEPLIADGTSLVFDKREEPKPGNLVALWFTREAAPSFGDPGWFKRLVSVPPPGLDGLIVVEQLNPPRRYSIPATAVLAIHKAVATAESLGGGRACYRPGRDRLPGGGRA